MAKTTRRSIIGEDPLDFVIPHAPTPSLNGHVRPERERAAAAGAAPPPRMEKERLTVHLSVDLIERVKNAVFWTPGLTLAELAQMALTEKLASLESRRGEPYPARTSPLKGGRPLK